MAIRIVDVKITPQYAWQDIKGLNDWNTVKNSNVSWRSISQTSKPGQNLKIEVEVTSGNWGSVKELFSTWADVKNKFSNWLRLKNW